MTSIEQAIHDMVVKALMYEPEIRHDYSEGEREIKRHEVLEQALVNILCLFPETEQAKKAFQHLWNT